MCVCALPLFSISSASSRISVFIVRVRKLRRLIMSKGVGDGWRRDKGRWRGGGGTKGRRKADGWRRDEGRGMDGGGTKGGGEVVKRVQNSNYRNKSIMWILRGVLP